MVLLKIVSFVSGFLVICTCQSVLFGSIRGLSCLISTWSAVVGAGIFLQVQSVPLDRSGMERANAIIVLDGVWSREHSAQCGFSSFPPLEGTS